MRHKLYWITRRMGTLTGLGIALLLVSGCDLLGFDDETGWTDGSTDTQTPTQQTPIGTPTGGGGASAQCAVSSQGTPQGVPVEALSVADETIASYGDSLNQFWQKQLVSGACLYKADPAIYYQVQQNAISYSYPPVVIYDPALFQRFWKEWNSALPTMLIVAHEWGHQVQYANNIQYQTSFEYEQDADLRGGYYMGTQAQLNGSANVEEVARLLKEFACTTGDPDSVPWFSQGAHGSCQQRADAVISGFNQAVQTSTVGLGALLHPEEAAPTAGRWTGLIQMLVTVVDDENVSVGQQHEPYDYEVTIGANGTVTDEQGNGPLPGVGSQQIIPVHSGVYDFDIVSTTIKFSYDDNATRYEADLSVTEGTVNDLPTTGDGFSVDVYNLLSDGGMNVYLYDSLTLTTSTDVMLTVVIETTGTLSRAE
jgi:hypothetical protein